MTTLIIKSDSDKKTMLLTQLANELGLLVNANDFEELNPKTLATGIGRKATDEELGEYLSKGTSAKPIPLEAAFSKYLGKK